VRQLCLSRDLVPVGYLDDLRKRPEEEGGSVVPIAEISAEQREALIEKLRQVISDGEDCPVSSAILQGDVLTALGVL
jgi:hypothetical protein